MFVGGKWSSLLCDLHSNRVNAGDLGIHNYVLSFCDFINAKRIMGVCVCV